MLIPLISEMNFISLVYWLIQTNLFPAAQLSSLPWKMKVRECRSWNVWRKKKMMRTLVQNQCLCKSNFQISELFDLTHNASSLVFICFSKIKNLLHLKRPESLRPKSIWKVTGHFEYLNNWLYELDVIWQPYCACMNRNSPLRLSCWQWPCLKFGHLSRIYSNDLTTRSSRGWGNSKALRKYWYHLFKFNRESVESISCSERFSINRTLENTGSMWTTIKGNLQIKN